MAAAVVIYIYNCAMCYSTCNVQVGIGWLLFLFIVVAYVLFNFQDGGWLLFIFKVVPCVACNFQDGRWVLTKLQSAPQNVSPLQSQISL